MTKLSTLFGVRERTFRGKDGRWTELIGIELELEGVAAPPALDYWSIHEDNSLRGGIEYVLREPYAGPSLDAAISEFFDANVNHKSTARTSTHIHLNMTDTTLDHLRSMMIVVYGIEDAIFNIVGNARKWSGYAMPLSEMEPTRLRMCMSMNDLGTILTQLAPARNQERYYGFNTASLRRHGTVEFRYFPGAPTREELENWLDLVVSLKQKTAGMDPVALIERLVVPTDVVGLLDELLPRSWVNDILKETPPEYILDKMNQIGALTVEPEVIEQRDNLVFLTQPFVRFVKNRFLKEEGRKYLDIVTGSMQVVSPNDWWAYLETAIQRDGGKLAPKRKTVRIGDPQLEVNPFGGAAAGGIWLDDQAPAAQPQPARGFAQYAAVAAEYDIEDVQRRVQDALVNPPPVFRRR